MLTGNDAIRSIKWQLFAKLLKEEAIRFTQILNVFLFKFCSCLISFLQCIVGEYQKSNVFQFADFLQLSYRQDWDTTDESHILATLILTVFDCFCFLFVVYFWQFSFWSQLLFGFFDYLQTLHLWSTTWARWGSVSPGAMSVFLAHLTLTWCIFRNKVVFNQIITR